MSSFVKFNLGLLKGHEEDGGDESRHITVQHNKGKHTCREEPDLAAVPYCKVGHLGQGIHNTFKET